MNKRNFGIDLLKIFSMYMICVLHVINRGGVLRNYPIYSSGWHFTWILYILAYCSVNCFAMVSGYVGVDSTYHYKKIFRLWLQTLFYSFFISLIFFIINPEFINKRTLIYSLFPVSMNQYWYFTAYFLMFFLIPQMNYILNNQSHDTIKYFIWIYFALFSLFYWFPIVHRIGNILHEGLSALWLSFLYIIGGYIKKFGIKSLLGLEEIITPPLKKQILHISKMQIKSKLYCHILGVIFCVIITHTLSILTNKISHSDNYMHNIVNNISPSILILSIFMLKIFASIQVNNIHFIKIIEFLTPLTFGVYLIHVHKCIYNILIKDLFVWISDAPIYLLWEYILISALCIFIICILIDYMRFKLFRFLHI